MFIGSAIVINNNPIGVIAVVYNIIDAGYDVVLATSTSTVNLIHAGEDLVQHGTTINALNEVDAGYDVVQ